MVIWQWTKYSAHSQGCDTSLIPYTNVLALPSPIVREHDDVTLINIHDITHQLIGREGHIGCIQTGQ